MSFPYPFMVIASDGKSMRALKPAQLGRHAPAIEAALCDLLLVDPDAPAAPAPQPPTIVPVAVHVEVAALPTMTQGEMARAKGYTGDCCSNCHEFRMKQSGHCLVCDACGTTTGCS